MRKRSYNQATDFARVGEFLVRNHDPIGGHRNWLQPRWEYMHYHPLIWDVDLSSAGLWEHDGEIAGVVHQEHGQGGAYFQLSPAHLSLRIPMLEHAEAHLSGIRGDKQFLDIHINDDDLDLQRIASGRGYKRTDGCDQMAHLDPSAVPTPAPLPDGFRLLSLADNNDLRRIDRCLWRGFNHEGEPPEDGPEEREFMQSAPGFRRDLNIVAEAPDGSFVSYCGMWYEPTNAIAYVEPVATDPDHRGFGLGRACVLEGIRRCGRLGAVQAWVGSTIPFYLALGFKPAYRISLWRREWPLKPNKSTISDA